MSAGTCARAGDAAITAIAHRAVARKDFRAACEKTLMRASSDEVWDFITAIANARRFAGNGPLDACRVPARHLGLDAFEIGLTPRVVRRLPVRVEIAPGLVR